MKTIKLLFAIMIAFITTQNVNAQSDKSQRTIGLKTVAVKVYGQCDMSRKKIENAALAIEGIKAAAWNEDNKQLTLTYDVFKKNTVDILQQQLAGIGFDTQNYRAADAAYKQLPACCQYQRKQS